MFKNKILIISIIIGTLAIVATILVLVLNKPKRELVSVEGNANAISYSIITYEQYEEKINNKENFILYIYSNTCSSCMEFKPKLDKVIKDNKLVIYGIETSLINNRIGWSYTPTIIIYGSGIEVSKINYYNNEKHFLSDISFKAYLDEYVLMPTIE